MKISKQTQLAINKAKGKGTREKITQSQGLALVESYGTGKIFRSLKDWRNDSEIKLNGEYYTVSIKDSGVTTIIKRPVI